MRTSLRAGLTGIAIAATALVVVTASTASSDPVSSSSAYGVSAGGSPGQPSVESDGTQDRTAGGHAPTQLGPLASGGALALSAGDDHATATITDLTLGSAVAELPPEVTKGLANLTQVCESVQQGGEANQVLTPLNDAINQIPGLGQVVEEPTVEAAAAFCDGLLDSDILALAEVGSLQAQCTDQTGTVALRDVSVLGAQQPGLAGDIAPETQLLPAELAPVARITLNHQSHDGEDFTVEGLRLEVGGEVVAVLASVTCGGPAPQEAEVEDAATKRNKLAPVPTPTTTSAPVTG